MFQFRALIVLLFAMSVALSDTWAKDAPAAAATESEKEEFNSFNDGTHVGWITLKGALREGPAPMSLTGASSGRGTLKAVLDQMNNVATDEKYKGIVIEFDGFIASFAQINDLERGIKKIRDKGKKVISFARSYSLTNYLLACSTDQILLQRTMAGSIELRGLGSEEMYMAGLLEKIGMKADMIQVGRYKGADESMTRSAPSRYWNENFDALLDDIYAQIIERIATARKLKKDEVEKLFKDGMTLTDAEYVKRKVIDRVVTPDLKDPDNAESDAVADVYSHRYEWDEDMGQRASAPKLDNPLMLFQQLFAPQRRGANKPSVAVIHCTGPIFMGDSSDGGLFGGRTIGSRTIVEALKEAKDDTHIKGVILRIDSPGGSALASEIIWQAMQDFMTTGEKKPIYVSVGNMAASGGYYMACAGQQVYAAPASIIGSIGVVGGKITMGGLYKKLGIGVHVRSRGPNAGMFNSVSPFTMEQREMIKKSMKQVYDQFTDRVKSGRGERVRVIDQIAQGRIFTGRQCVENGMVDHIGGLDVVIADLAKAVELEEGAYDVVDLPHPPSFAEALERAFSLQAPRMTAQQVATIDAARAVLGDETWQNVSSVMSGMMLLRKEPVLTLMPVAVRIR